MAKTTGESRRRAGLTLGAAALLTALAGAATRGPDPAGYSATDETVYSFVDLAGGGASVLDDTDDGTAALTLPFAFSFYGAPRSLLCVSANGAAYFVGDLAACSGIVDFANTDLSSTNPPGDTPGLFPFWSDLTFDQAGAGSVLYQTQGAVGSRRFIVQWHNAYPSGSASPVTFQLVLTEGTSQVLFQYRSVDLGNANPATKGAAATVGIRNAGALVSGQQIQWSFNVPVVANESALAFSVASSGPDPAVFAKAGLSPAIAVTRPHTSHTVTATAVTTAGAPVAGVTMTFDVLTGPNSAAGGSAITNASGQASFTYTDTSTPAWPKIDTIQASFGGNGSNIVQKVWVLRCDANSDNRVNGADLVVIARAVGQTASGPYDPRDGNGDGQITALDVSYCQGQFVGPAPK
jgi:hypothetical protein